MATAGAILNVGTVAGKNVFQLDYSTGPSSGILSLTPSAWSTSADIANIFYASPDGNWACFQAPVTGQPIATNGYPRTESREEIIGGGDRAFNPMTGDHSMDYIFMVPHLPPVKPSAVVGQIHDNLGDLLENAVQPSSTYALNGKVELVTRIMGTSSGLPKLDPDFKFGQVYRARIRTGAIAPGGLAGWAVYLGDMVTPVLKSWDPGMPSISTSGAQSYHKLGCYLQTKHTSNGTGGLETDSAEYGVVWIRDWHTNHNGETASAQLSFGTDAVNAVSAPRYGVAAKATGASITPAFPTSTNAPVAGDLVYAVVRAYRASTSAVVATPTTATPGWARVNNWPVSGAVITDPGVVLAGHTIRYQLYVAEYVTGLAAPVITTGGGSDTMHGIVAAATGARLPAGAVDQIGAVGTSATNTTTTMGPAPALPNPVPPGSLILALLDHEYTKASGTLTTITGDSLTWVEGEQNIATWAHILDHALNASAVTPGQKTLAGNTFATTGKGIGQQISILPRDRKCNMMIAA